MDTSLLRHLGSVRPHVTHSTAETISWSEKSANLKAVDTSYQTQCPDPSRHAKTYSPDEWGTANAWEPAQQQHRILG